MFCELFTKAIEGVSVLISNQQQHSIPLGRTIILCDVLSDDLH